MPVANMDAAITPGKCGHKSHLQLARHKERLKNGNYHDVHELLTKALEALPEKAAGTSSHAAAVQRMLQFSRENSVKLLAGETVEQLVRDSHRS